MRLREAALLFAPILSGGCRCERAADGEVALPATAAIAALHSFTGTPLGEAWLGSPPSGVAPIADQQVGRLQQPLARTNTLRSSWFPEFEPAVRSGRLVNGTPAIEVAWEEGWYQRYSVVFVLDRTGAEHEVTHVGLLSSTDIGNGWMTVDSIRIRAFEDDEQLHLAFAFTVRRTDDADPVDFEGAVAVRTAAFAPGGPSDLHWVTQDQVVEALRRGGE